MAKKPEYSPEESRDILRSMFVDRQDKALEEARKIYAASQAMNPTSSNEIQTPLKNGIILTFDPTRKSRRARKGFWF